MNWRFELTRPARKDLDKLDNADAVRVLTALQRLTRELTEQGQPALLDVKQLRGAVGQFRLRAGELRAIFVKATVKDGGDACGVITVLHIRHRSGSYNG